MGTAVSVPAQESKLWACLKQEFLGLGSEDLANNPALGWLLEQALSKMLAKAIGFKGKSAEIFAETAAESIHNLVTNITTFHYQNATSASFFAMLMRSATDLATGLATGTAEALKEAGLGGGLKLVGKNFLLPYKIATFIWDWFGPLLPCLLKDKPVPDKQPAEQASSPLVIDLTGDGVGSYKLKNGVYFDLDNNGFKEKTAWAHYQDGLLALDLNGNGTIDNGAELFGNHTKLKNGTLATNGFEALAQYDDNGDGVINNKDKVWKNLLVWQDKVNDGVSQSDELTKIAKTGITEIQLGYKNSIIGVANDTIFAFQAA